MRCSAQYPSIHARPHTTTCSRPCTVASENPRKAARQWKPSAGSSSRRTSSKRNGAKACGRRVWFVSNGARPECPRPLAKGHGGVESATRGAATAGNRLSGQSSRRSFFKAIGGLLIPLQPPAPDIGAVTFVDIAAEAGLAHAKNVSGAPESKQTLLEEMGCGVALFDYDNDGWLDIFLVNGTAAGAPPRGRKPTSYLFRNNRDGTFTDVTQKAGLTHSGWGQACCAADYDNDGFTDLFVTYWGRNVLYHNNGDGTFTDVSEKAGVAGSAGRWGA